MIVPVDSPRFIFRERRRPDCRLNVAFGPGPSKTPGTPREKDISWTLPSRLTVTSNHRDSAFTAEAPTPCRPPDALYPEPPNLPPACSRVSTSSTPLNPDLPWTSVGMPRPSSATSTLPSACSVTTTFEACPATPSSVELSTISVKR